MELDGVNLAVGIFDGGDGAVRAAHGAKAWWKSDDMVAVTIPDTQGLGKLGEQLRFVGGVLYVRYCAAVFAAFGGFDLAGQLRGEPLHAVADSQHRDAEGQNV